MSYVITPFEHPSEFSGWGGSTPFPGSSMLAKSPSRYVKFSIKFFYLIGFWEWELFVAGIMGQLNVWQLDFMLF
jgi:hypothetical protein